MQMTICPECEGEVPQAELICCECGACVCTACFSSAAHRDCGEDTPLEPCPPIEVVIEGDKVRIAGD